MYYPTPKPAITWIHHPRSPMPGSIQVSVLDFKELPSSSKFVKISLGKVEHEAGEKGTFSFPLPNLRNNLIITVLDSEGNQVAHSGVRTVSIIEKGTWDDLFPMEGGGLVHMKLQFVLSDEERNRIRSMREYAMKKKQDEILSSRLRNAESAKSLASSLSRHEVSDVLRATSSQDIRRSSINGDAAKADPLTPLDDTSMKAAESSDGMKEESFERQLFTNAADRMEERSFSPMMDVLHQKASTEVTESQASQPDLVKKNKAATSMPADNMAEKLLEQNFVKIIPSDIKRKSEESISIPLLQETEVNSSKNYEIQLQKAMVEDTETLVSTDLVNKDNEAESKPLDNLAEQLDTRSLGEESTSYIKKATGPSKTAHSPQETKVNTIKNNEIRFQQANNPKRLQDASSPDVGSSRSMIAEKIKSFSPKLAIEPDNLGSLEKTPRSIKKIISVFESSISQDRIPLKPVSTKSYRVGTFRLLKDPSVKDNYERSESSMERLNNSEMSSSTRLRNSFSTGDLRKHLSSIVTKVEQVGSDDKLVEPSETNMQSKGMIASTGDMVVSGDPEGREILPKDFTTSTKVIPESPEEGVNVNEKVSHTESNTMEILKSPEEGLKNEKKFAVIETYTKKLLKSHEEKATVSGRMDGDKESKAKDAIHGKKTSKDNLEYFYHHSSGPWIFPDEKRRFCMTAEGDRAMSLLGDCSLVEKGHQEDPIASIPESIFKSDGIVKEGEVIGNSSPEGSDEEDSARSLGQAIKIALVVGFGVLVLLFRQREPGKGKKKENKVGLKNQVVMKKRGGHPSPRVGGTRLY